MSRPNTEIAARAIAALNQGDVDAYLGLCAPDVEMVSPMAALEGIDRGEAGIRRAFSRIDEATSNFRLEVERVEAVGEHRVIAFTRLSVSSDAGFAVTQEAASVYDLTDGKIRRVEVFMDRQRALEAVGMRE